MNHAELLPVYNEMLFDISPNSQQNVREIGDFQQKVMAIVHQKVWNSENEVFIKKILQSCGLSEEGYRVSILADSSYLFETINRAGPHVLFLFGFALQSDFFKSNRSLYKPFTFNGIKVVMADEPDVVRLDKEKRLMLWNQCIKPLFNIA